MKYPKPSPRTCVTDLDEICRRIPQQPAFRFPQAAIYHGDCRQLLAHIEAVDLVMTDPPYGMSYRSRNKRLQEGDRKVLNDHEYDVEVLRQLIDKARHAVYAFGRWDNLKTIPQPRSVIAWVKNSWSSGDLQHEYGRQWEMCAFWAKPGHRWAQGRPSDIVFADRVSPRHALHPTQKPLALVSKLLQDCDGTTVLDPYCGSGTTLLAAVMSGRAAIGIDLDLGHCRRTAQRIEEFLGRIGR